MAGSSNMGNALSPGATSGTPSVSMPGVATRLSADPMNGGSPLPQAPQADTPEGPLPKGQRADTSGPFGDVHANLNQAVSRYRVGQRAQQVLDHVREELDNLMDMGDVVRPEDVIGAAGRLVGKGIGAQQLATLLSSMPTVGGEGLASWVRMHDLTIRQAEMALQKENDLSRHQMGVAGMRSLAANAAEDHIRGQARNAAAAMRGSMGALAPASGVGGGAARAGGGMPSMSVLQVQQPSPADEGAEAQQ